MKHLPMYIAGLCCCGASMPGYAQTSDFERALRGHAVDARVGVTIPFGGDSKKVQSKPQFALGLRQDSVRPKTHDWAMRPDVEEREVREIKLALTMEASPQLLINDQHFDLSGDTLAARGSQNALDTFDKTTLAVIAVSLGVIAAVLVGVST